MDVLLILDTGTYSTGNTCVCTCGNLIKTVLWPTLPSESLSLPLVSFSFSFHFWKWKTATIYHWWVGISTDQSHRQRHWPLSLCYLIPGPNEKWGIWNTKYCASSYGQRIQEHASFIISCGKTKTYQCRVCSKSHSPFPVCLNHFIRIERLSLRLREMFDCLGLQTSTLVEGITTPLAIITLSSTSLAVVSLWGSPCPTSAIDFAQSRS